MSCEERARLDLDHSQAKARHQAARETLDSKIGVSTRDEFLRLSHAIDHAWDARERARYLLEQHLQEHGCGHDRPASEAASEAASEG